MSKRGRRCARDEGLQVLAPLAERQGPQILAVKGQQVVGADMGGELDQHLRRHALRG